MKLEVVMERGQFAREFKVETEKLIQERGVTVAQASRHLGLHSTVLRRWLWRVLPIHSRPFQARGR